MRHIKLINLLALILACTTLGMPGQSIAKDNIEQSGDTVQIILPIVALGSSFYLEDKVGQNQFYESFLTNILITHGLKNITNKERPNGSNTQSFPSGHTSASFQAAAYIHKRYGVNYAFPAYVAATFVGYSRVESKKHYTEDVVAGAILGTLSSFYFTTPYKGLQITPLVSEHQVGIQVKMRW